MKTNFLMDSFGRLLGVIKGKGKMLSEESEVAMQQEVSDFEEFDDTTSYSEGDVVRKDGKLYKFTATHEGEWSDDDVEQTNVFTILKDMIQNQPSGGPEIIEFSGSFNDLTNKTKSEFITALGITENQLNTMLDETKQCCIKFRVGYTDSWHNVYIVNKNAIDNKHGYGDDPDDETIYLLTKTVYFGLSDLKKLVNSTENQLFYIWDKIEPVIPPQPLEYETILLKLVYDVLNDKYSISKLRPGD